MCHAITAEDFLETLPEMSMGISPLWFPLFMKCLRTDRQSQNSRLRKQARHGQGKILEYPVVERSLYPTVRNSKWTRSPYGKSQARADSGSYVTLIEDIKYIAEVYLSRESHITEQQKVAKFLVYLVSSCVCMPCALCVGSLWLSSLALSFTRAHTAPRPSISHFLAPSDPRSLLPLHSPKPGGEDGWGGRRKQNCPSQTDLAYK